jgi:topoisomerase-4 subunit A
VRVQLHPNSNARIKEFDFDFSTLDIKGRGAVGNILTKFPVRKVDLKEKGKSTIGGLKLWLDEKYGRLVSEESEKSKYLGEFHTGDQVLVVFKDGNIELTNYEVTNKYEMDDIYLVEKFDKERVYSCVYFDGDSKNYYVKRFKIELKKEKEKSSLITDHKDSKLVVFSSKKTPSVKFHYLKGKEKEKLESEVKLQEIIDVKGWKALGNRLSQFLVTGKVVDTTVDEEEDLEVGDSVEWDIEEESKPSPKSTTKGKQTDLF